MSDANVPKYRVDVASFAKSGATKITDIRLAYKMGNDKDMCVNLLEISVSNRTYQLELCGHLRLSPTSSMSIPLTDDQLELLENGEARSEIEFTPWFQWVNEDGDADACDAFDEISIDPQVEIDKLRQMLQANGD